MPFLKEFERVDEYIQQFKRNLHNPYYLQVPMNRINTDKVLIQNDTEMTKLLESSGCRVRPHQYLTTLKILKFREEVDYLYEIFKSIYHKY